MAAVIIRCSCSLFLAVISLFLATMLKRAGKAASASPTLIASDCGNFQPIWGGVR
jgi:hypothetical protein